MLSEIYITGEIYMNVRYNQIIEEKKNLAAKMKTAVENENEELYKELFKKYKKLESEAKKIHKRFYER